MQHTYFFHQTVTGQGPSFSLEPCPQDLKLLFDVHTAVYRNIFHHHHHHHKHQELDPLNRSVSRVAAARANASSVFQLFSFLVVCSGMISKRFGFVEFFASVFL